MDNVREKVCSFDNLYNAMGTCKKGVTWKDSVSRYANNGLVSTLKLKGTLDKGTYQIDPYYKFTIHEPKTRDIVSTKYKDRIFQRSLCDNYLYKEITKSFVYDNGACQEGKGTDFTRKRLKIHLQRFHRKHGMRGYVLKCDLKSYFASTPHSTIKHALHRVIKSPWVLEHVCRIVDSYNDSNNPGVGVGLGSQITQLTQLLVLSDLDHTIKEKMKIRHYIRYMDDLLLIHHDKKYLKQCQELIYLELEKLGLTPNIKKTKIFPLSQGIKFLGFRYGLTDTGKIIATITKENVRKRKRKLKKYKNLVVSGRMTKEKFDQCYTSWKAHVSKGNSHKLIKYMDAYCNDLRRDMINV